MKTTLKQYAENNSFEHAMAMAGAIVQLISEQGKVVDVELNAQFAANQVDPSVRDIYLTYEKIHGVVRIDRPALAGHLTLGKGGELCMQIGNGMYGHLPRTPAGLLDAIDEVFFFDVDFIQGIADQYVQETVQEFLAEINTKVSFYERAQKKLEEGELVILPHGIPGTQVTHTIYAKVVESFHPPIRFERDAEEYDARLVSLDPHGRVFFFYINSGRVVRAGAKSG